MKDGLDLEGEQISRKEKKRSPFLCAVIVFFGSLSTSFSSFAFLLSSC